MNYKMRSANVFDSKLTNIRRINPPIRRAE